MVKKKNFSSDSKAIALAFKACLAEYDRMIKEIMMGLEWHKSLIQYSLVISGTAASAIPFFPTTLEIYLVASILLSAIGWAFVEQSYKMLLFGQYIVFTLKPKVNRLVQLSLEQFEGSDSSIENLLGFDDFFRKGDLRTALLGIPALGKFAIAVVPGIGFAVAYWFALGGSFHLWSSTNQISFVIALVVALIPLVFGILVGPAFYRHGQGNPKSKL